MKYISYTFSKYVLSCSTKRAMTGFFRGALCSLGVLNHSTKGAMTDSFRREYFP